MQKRKLGLTLIVLSAVGLAYLRQPQPTTAPASKLLKATATVTDATKAIDRSGATESLASALETAKVISTEGPRGETPRDLEQRIQQLDRTIDEQARSIKADKVVEQISLRGISEADRNQLLGRIQQLNRLRLQRLALTEQKVRMELARLQ